MSSAFDLGALKAVKYMESNEISRNRRNSNQLRSSKGFLKARICLHSVFDLGALKSVKSQKTGEIATKWDRAKVSLGARLRLHSAFDLGALRSVKSMKSQKNR